MGSAFDCEVFQVRETEQVEGLYILTFTPWVVETYSSAFVFPANVFFPVYAMYGKPCRLYSLIKHLWC